MDRDINIIIMGRPVPTWDEPKDNMKIDRDQEDDVIYNLVKDKGYHVIHRGSIMITIIVEDHHRVYDDRSSPSLYSGNSSDEDDPNSRTGPYGRPFF